VSAEGRLIAGRYRLQQKIGSGAMGVVWQAVDERLHRTVAVKQLLLQPGYTPEETEEARQRSMREGRIAARLQHQHAIAVFDVAEDEGQPVLIMEYLPSTSLASVIDEHGVQPALRVAHIGVQVAGALAAAHMAGIVHRDLKPGNILLGEQDLAKITDFGISRAIGDVAVTKSGILAGTPAYLAPEVALGRDPAPASDVFSLGSTLYSAIEGGPPFGTDENAISLLHRVARGQFDPPRQAGPMTPALMQMLRPDPVDRPTMAQTRDLLQAVVDGRQVPNFAPGGGWARPSPQPAPAAPAPPPPSGGGTLHAPQGGMGTNPSPPTRVGAAAPVAAPERRRGKTIALWFVAIAVAALIGIMAVNAFGESGQEQSAPQPSTPAPAPSPAPTTTSAASTTTSAASTTSAEPTTSSSEPTTTSKKPTKKDLVTTVEKYYKLVPDDLDNAWKLLGPKLQSQGKDDYEAFWKTIDDVKIVGDPMLSGSNVVVTLQFTKDGKKSNEMHVLGMAQTEDGKVVINTDRHT
jgi:eukaryotic-like serine/threonine-protein kinase